MLWMLSKNKGPLVRRRDHVQAIGSAVQRFAFDGYGVRKSNRGVLIGSGAPYLSIGHERIPNFTSTHQRTVVVDRDIGHAHSLHHGGVLAWSRQVEYGGLRLGQVGYKQQPQQQCKRPIVAHRYNASPQ